jgi:cellulose synthase/poly-beta-1,6-N-acetylglucosamine synthase-like glycosyltransferase
VEDIVSGHAWSWLLIVNLAMITYVYAGYPLLILLISQFRRKRLAPVDPARQPTISLIIAAYNEALAIRPRLDNALSLRYPKDRLEIIVVSDGSSDETAAIVRNYADPRIRLVELAERGGKTMAQNAAVRVARGEILVFSDATTVYDSDALGYIASNYADPAVGAVSGRYDYRDLCAGSPTSPGSSAFWKYENAIKRAQSRIHTLTGCSGCIYSIRRSLYTYLEADDCSDLVEPLHVVRQGYRVVFDERARAFEDTSATMKAEFRMRVRVAGHGIHALVRMRGLLNVFRHGWVSFQLFSHKVLRWSVPFQLVCIHISTVALLLAEHTEWYLYALFAAQALFYGLALLALLLPKAPAPLAIPLHYCTINFAVFASLWQLAHGNRNQTWETIRAGGG